MSLNYYNFAAASRVNTDPRIVGGYEVDPPFKYPTMVSLQDEDGHFCGGSLYKHDTVITAAHCSEGSVDGIVVKVHRHDLTKSDQQESGKTYTVKSKIIHPKYDGNTLEYDVAIWKLIGAPSTRTDLELDNGSIGSQTGKMLLATGWGTTSSEGNLSPVLLQVDLPVYDNNKCAKAYPDGYTRFNKTLMVCAGYPEGEKDTCQGDSGGPLFATQPYSKKLVLVGTTSYGEGCAQPNYPGVYARISALKSWIEQIA